jgi:NADH-quinone oxidoreductase subunit A
MTALVGYMVLFFVVGVGFILVHLLVGKVIRPAKPSAEKLTIYECGEPTIGSAWVQFDVRFYVVALLFVIFDVEVAFFFPWAVVFGQANTVASAPEIPEQRVAAVQESEQLRLAQRELLEGQPPTFDTVKAAGDLALLAFFDIFVFFGVLLVGFAYLAARGDLRWVRSLAEQQPPPTVTPPAPPAPARELAGAGRS